MGGRTSAGAVTFKSTHTEVRPPETIHFGKSAHLAPDTGEPFCGDSLWSDWDGGVRLWQADRAGDANDSGCRAHGVSLFCQRLLDDVRNRRGALRAVVSVPGIASRAARTKFFLEIRLTPWPGPVVYHVPLIRFYETHLPAFEEDAQAAIWFSRPDGDESRTCNLEPPPPAGTQTSPAERCRDPLRPPHRSLIARV